jgi:hypothetical protein
MATNYNYFGNLVTSGLVLNLDAAKVDSYPGAGTVWRDISGNGNNGTLTNGPTFTGIGKQAAIVFDGTDDYVTGSVINATTELSVFSFRNPKPRPGSVYPVLIGKWFVTPGDNRSWLIGSQPGGIESVVISSDGTYFNSTIKRYEFSSSFSNNIWSQVGFTFNNGVLIPYLNGAPVNYTASINANITRIHTSSIGYTIGSAQDGAFNLYFSGSVASSQIYNRAISQFEVWQNFNALKGRYGIPDIVTNGLVLNLDAGNPFSYLSGSSGTTWTNTVTVSSSISGTLVNGSVYANGAISFDGVDDRIGTNYSPTSYINTTQIIWYKWNGVNQLKVLSYFGNSGGNGFGLLLNDGSDGGNVGSRISVLYGGTYYNALNTGSLYAQLVSNQWCQLALTRDSSITTLYQNGNLIGSTSRTPNTSASYNFSYGDTTVGAAGNVSNMQFYTRVLSQAEITQNFNALRGRYGI